MLLLCLPFEPGMCGCSQFYSYLRNVVAGITLLESFPANEWIEIPILDGMSKIEAVALEDLVFTTLKPVRNYGNVESLYFLCNFFWEILATYYNLQNSSCKGVGILAKRE